MRKELEKLFRRANLEPEQAPKPRGKQHHPNPRFKTIAGLTPTKAILAEELLTNPNITADALSGKLDITLHRIRIGLKELRQTFPDEKSIQASLKIAFSDPLFLQSVNDLRLKLTNTYHPNSTTEED